MKYSLLPLLLLVALLGLSMCKKRDTTPTKPEDQLPPATQTGAGTFGCLVNGQPYLPSGGGLFNNPNLLVTYDPAYNGGNLAITAYRVLGSTTLKQYIGVGGDGISQTGTYTLATYIARPTGPLQTPYFSDGSKAKPCNEYLNNPGTSATGQLIISRLDKQAHIVSGSFSFTLTQPGCDTIRVTAGRFDSRI